jgi:hypothetical protein
MLEPINPEDFIIPKTGISSYISMNVFSRKATSFYGDCSIS